MMTGMAAAPAAAEVPQVAALWARADEVIGAELRRLRGRRPELTGDQDEAIAQAVHSVARHLLDHAVARLRCAATGPGGAGYSARVGRLFDLRPHPPTRPSPPAPTPS
jgi:glutamyl-tRNA reductase